MQNNRSTLPNNTQTRKPAPTRPRAKARSSLNSGLDVLECLVENRRPMTLTEIATALGISKSNVHQLLATLTRRRLIERLRAGH